MTRSERRRERRAALRSKLMAERLAGDERESVLARQRALLASIPLLEVPAGYVVLLAERVAPHLAAWDVLPLALAAIGVELHADTLAQVDSCFACGRVPALVSVDGWINVAALQPMPFVAGGAA